jgi:hypothetical protein
VQEKIAIFTSRIQRFDTALAEKISTVAFSMANNIQNYLSAYSEIPDVDDDNPRIGPEAPCYKETFAIQWRDVQNGGRRFTIKSSLYNHRLTDNDMRAGI